METRCTYEKKDVEAAIGEVHQKRFPAPDGMKWDVVSQSFGDVVVTAIPIKDDKKEETE